MKLLLDTLTAELSQQLAPVDGRAIVEIHVGDKTIRVPGEANEDVARRFSDGLKDADLCWLFGYVKAQHEGVDEDAARHNSDEPT